MHFKRFLPFFISVSSFLLIEAYLFRPSYIYACVLIADILIIFSVWRLSRESLIDKKWWNYAILPVLFFDSLVSYSVLMPYRGDASAVQALFVAGTAFLYFYLRAVYYHLAVPTADRRLNFDNISSFGNFISLYFIFSTLYGLQSFLNLKIWHLLPAIFLFSYLLTYQLFWTMKSEIKKNIFLVSVCALVISEIAWTLFYLPFSFYVTGAILSIDYYMLLGIVKMHVSGGLNARGLKLYLGFGSTAIFVILFTSRWL